MKNLQFTLRALGFACLALFMSSATCELFSSAENLTFTVNLDHEFIINEEEDNQDGKDYETKQQDEVLDAVQVNKDFAEHADLIESIEVNSVTYVLSAYASKYDAIAFSSGQLTFSDPDAPSGTGNAVVVNYNVADLQALSNSGDETELTIDQASADEIANLLKTKKKVRIHATGHLSKVPLYLKVKMTVNATLEARLL